MSHPSDNSHYVRRVVLPSGRSIEVVYFDAQPVDVAPEAPAKRTDTVRGDGNGFRPAALRWRSGSGRR